MCVRGYLNGGNNHEGIQMVRKPVEDNRLLEGSTGKDSLHSSDNVLDDGGGNYDYFPTCSFSKKKKS